MTTLLRAVLVEPGADQTYLYADPVHPTTGMHRVLAEDAERLLKANDLW